MSLSTRDDLVKFYCNTPNRPKDPNHHQDVTIARFGLPLLLRQPRHSHLHIRNISHLILGRQYQICKAGHMGLIKVTAELVGKPDSSHLIFEFQNFREVFDSINLGLNHHPDKFWDNWNWIEGLNFWQTIL